MSTSLLPSSGAWGWTRFGVERWSRISNITLPPICTDDGCPRRRTGKANTEKHRVITTFYRFFWTHHAKTFCERLSNTRWKALAIVAEKLLLSKHQSICHLLCLSIRHLCPGLYYMCSIAAKTQKNGEVGDRNLDLPQSARCKADALPLSYIPNYFQL